MSEEHFSNLDLSDVNVLKEHWADFDLEQRRSAFLALSRPNAEDLFLTRSSHDQVDLVHGLPLIERRSWIRLLPLDDTADFIQHTPAEDRSEVLGQLDDQTRREVMGLLAYAEDDAGGLMNPQYIRLRPDMTVDEAIRYLRAQAKTHIETIYYAYVLDADQRLVGVVSFRDLLLATADKLVRDMMHTDIVSVPEEMDREEVARQLQQHNLMALPVLQPDGKMKGIVTYDDIVDVLQKEATEDIQKLGGVEALDAPYFQVGFFQMLKKRAGWLTVLFLGEMVTASAMSRFEDELARAIVLALFIPLIISSGGNSGSQASTLVIRALALRELRLRDWWRVLVRELGSGLALGGILGAIGWLRIVLWQQIDPIYSEHYVAIAVTVALSLVGIVVWGTLVGSMLPFVLRRVGWDPATASAPMVATLVDVTGLIIYFSVASIVLKGILL